MNILCGFEGRPNFDDISWSSVSPETQKVKILLKRLLIEDYKKNECCSISPHKFSSSRMWDDSSSMVVN
ncbi:hypothetical protein HanPSC8_Chr10g0407581 [Helianthus annuus]|nr:hypothetical protein HanPSC8_Chr10g0407581 [Helianthus annuus]